MCGQPPLIRKINRKNILKTIEKDFPLSRTQLSKKIGLSLPSVSRIVDTLIAEDVLREVGKGQSSGGRKPLLVEINATHRYVFGVEVSRQSSVICCDLMGNILERSSLVPDISEGPLSIARQVSFEVERLRVTLGIDPDRVVGVGIGTPGYLFKSSTRVRNSFFYGWHQTNVNDIFPPLFPYPVFIENVARASTLAEAIFGWGREYKSFFYAYLDWGTGGGIVSDGKLWRGRDGLAGEFGHTIVERHGIPCYCGNLGCIEQYTSTAAIVREAKRLGWCRSEPDVPEAIHDFDAILEDFASGDPVIRSVLAEAGKVLGLGLAGAINLLNPDVVVLGGEISRRCPFVCENAIVSARENIFSLAARDTPIFTSQAGKESVALGAARRVITNYFEQLM
ncbi:MAG TPA: ROK family transcriptional regulator [Atribacteraceae bacterium]|nr:ROK family transcriptional regulator [Atribacteraceae bacterium]